MNESNKLASRARLAIIGATAMMVATAALLILEAGEGLGLLAYDQSTELAFTAIGLGYTVAFLVSVVLVAMWIHRAHANLHAAGWDALEFTPGWAVGWYFVPLANLIKPYQAMRELWNTSMREDDYFVSDAPMILKLWWGTWIAGNILSNIATRMQGYGTDMSIQYGGMLGAVSSLLLIVCAWNLVGIIRSITRAQSEGLVAAQVFA